MLKKKKKSSKVTDDRYRASYCFVSYSRVNCFGVAIWLIHSQEGNSVGYTVWSSN